MYISLKTEAAAASIYVSSAAVAIFSKSFPLNYLRSKQFLSAMNTIPDLKILSDICSHYCLSLQSLLSLSVVTTVVCFPLNRKPHVPLAGQTMDVRAMRFEDNTFDAVIDKGEKFPRNFSPPLYNDHQKNAVFLSMC